MALAGAAVAAIIGRVLAQSVKEAPQALPDVRRRLAAGDAELLGVEPRPRTASLTEVGWVQQLVVNQTTGNLTDGHLRLELALSRGEPSIPVIYVELSDAEEALILATLDPRATMAETDQAKLLDLLAGVTISQADLATLVKDMAGRPIGAPSPDSVRALPDDRNAQAGELWLLGEHRLLCGDATKADDVARLRDAAAPGDRPAVRRQARSDLARRRLQRPHRWP